MNPDDIRPADVYAQVRWIVHVLYVLCTLVAFQILAKFLLFRRVVLVLWRVEAVLGRVESLLGIVEKHAELTERQQERVKTDTLLAADVAARAMDSIPEKVVEKIRTEAESGKLPVLASEWKPGDPDRRRGNGG
jgi:hypothetical protein